MEKVAYILGVLIVAEVGAVAVLSVVQDHMADGLPIAILRGVAD